MAIAQSLVEAIRVDVESKKMTVVDIAKKHGVNRLTVKNLWKKHKWRGRKTKRKKKIVIKRKTGQPTRYKSEYDKQAIPLCMLGYTNEKLAEFFGVHIDTLYEWKNKHVTFSEALSVGREKASSQIAVSLFQRAKGYSHEEEKVFCSDGKIITYKTTKHYPPEVKAIALWLKNKYPELWKEKQEIEGYIKAVVGEITKDDAKVVKNLFDDITE